MQLTELTDGLSATCQVELASMITSFQNAPTSSGISGAAAVAEVLVLGDEIGQAQSLREMLSDAAGAWLRSGIIEEFCYSRVELIYPAALLAYMAQQGARYRAFDMSFLKRLIEGRLVGRGEAPVLTQYLISAYFTRCGADTDFGDLGRRDLAQMIDKRVLRARSDEYDLLVALMCAQLLRLRGGVGIDRPTVYPQVLLAQAIRCGNANWVPVLAFLCAGWFALDDRLRRAALESMVAALPPTGELPPPPQGAAIDSEYISRAGRGLRIRSMVALIFSLCTLGEEHAAERDFTVVH